MELEEIKAAKEAADKAWALRLVAGKAKLRLAETTDAEAKIVAGARDAFSAAKAAIDADAAKRTSEARDVYLGVTKASEARVEAVKREVDGANQKMAAYAAEFEKQYGEPPFPGQVASGGRTRV